MIYTNTSGLILTLISVYSEVYATTSEKTKHRYFSLKKLDYMDILRAIVD